ncbi:putative chemotaxis protein-glutamate methylesterase [Geomonas sp. Red276]
MADERLRYHAVAIGISTGGVTTLKPLLGALPADFRLPILVVQHVSPDSGARLAMLLDRICALHVKEADEQDIPVGGTVYLAPPNYHLLVEPDRRLGFSTDPPVNFARPSVDVLFETAADAYGEELVGVVLTGAGEDGARGLRRIKDKGGLAVIQEPADAVASAMPQAALMAVAPDHLVTLAALPQLLINLSEAKRS